MTRPDGPSDSRQVAQAGTTAAEFLTHDSAFSSLFSWGSDLAYRLLGVTP